jgi:hypothetical protein
MIWSILILVANIITLVFIALSYRYIKQSTKIHRSIQENTAEAISSQNIALDNLWKQVEILMPQGEADGEEKNEED